MADNWLAFENQPKQVNSDICFEAISELDMAFLSELYRTTRWEEVQQAPWTDEQRIDFLHQQFTAQHQHYQSHYPQAKKWIIKQGDQPIGRIYVDREPEFICLIDVALLPEYQSLGIGTMLLKELLIEAQAAQRKVVIHVERFNPAYQWYVKHGFQQIEDKGVYQYMEWHPKSNDQENTAS